MWQLITFNFLWFLMLFASHFFRKGNWRLGILLLACLAVFLGILQRSVIDPLVWMGYFLASLLTLWSGFQFRHWIYAKEVIFSEEIRTVSKNLQNSIILLEQRSLETEAISQKSSDIYYVYDKIREMSQSLDKFETFLIFGEALAGQLNFRSITLAFFDEESQASRVPQEAYGLTHKDFGDPFDKAYFLKNKKKFEAGTTPFLCKIFEAVLGSKTPLDASSIKSHASGQSLKTDPEYTPFTAYPIFINKEIFGILTVEGIHETEFPALSILAERFITEVERIRLYEKVEALAITDGLTSVHVRRHLMERLEEEISRSRKFGLNLSFLMIDIDHFKRFNDQYGHLVGDVVLKQTAEIIKKNTRELDLVGRYGGEEFAVLLVETDQSGASLAAERIRSAIAEKSFKAYDENLNVTVSIGCATFPKAEADPRAIVDVADRALYEAKHAGRNRVCIADFK